eukprot:g1272.t1
MRLLIECCDHFKHSRLIHLFDSVAFVLSFHLKTNVSNSYSFCFAGPVYAIMTTEDHSTVEVHVHSLVVMSIADHYTLAQRQQGKSRVTGLLFGKQRDQIVTVYEAFELADQTDAALAAFQAHDLPNFSKIYPDYECVGWYTTGVQASEEDAKFHVKITKDVTKDDVKEDNWRSERPLALYLNPDPAEDSKELPLCTYERVLIPDKEGSGRKMAFVRCPARLVSDEAERVTVVHCARTVTGDESEQSALVHPYQSMAKALENMNKRVKIIISFLSAVESGKIKPDQRILRMVKSLCDRLPTMKTETFRQDFYTEYNDAMLLTYLAAITKAQVALSGLINKHNIAGPKLDVVHPPGGGLPDTADAGGLVGRSMASRAGRRGGH